MSSGGITATGTIKFNNLTTNGPVYVSGGTLNSEAQLAISRGGTGLSSLGTANQLLGVNSGATALEYKNITSLLTAGSGISINGTATATISNTGVLSLNSLTGTLTLQGTTNQINVSSSGSTITLSTPQNIHSGASPTFSGLTLSSLTSGSVLFTGSGGLISQDNANLFWDDTNNRLGIGISTPGATLDVQGGAQFGTGDVNLIDSTGKIAGLSTTYFATDTSANLAGIITDETGSGALVFANSPTLTNLIIGSGGTAITKHISATTSIDFTNIATTTCNSTTVTVTGAATGDTVALGLPSGLESSLVVIGFVSAADTVTIRACNISASTAVDPAAGTYRIDVWKH